MDQQLIESSHRIANFEAHRTRILRQLVDQVNMLGDAQHALRNGSLEVTEEFLDRAITAIEKEIGNLRKLTLDT